MKGKLGFLERTYTEEEREQAALSVVMASKRSKQPNAQGLVFDMDYDEHGPFVEVDHLVGEFNRPWNDDLHPDGVHVDKLRPTKIPGTFAYEPYRNLVLPKLVLNIFSAVYNPEDPYAVLNALAIQAPSDRFRAYLRQIGWINFMAHVSYMQRAFLGYDSDNLKLLDQDVTIDDFNELKSDYWEMMTVMLESGLAPEYTLFMLRPFVVEAYNASLADSSPLRLSDPKTVDTYLRGEIFPHSKFPSTVFLNRG